MAVQPAPIALFAVLLTALWAGAAAPDEEALEKARGLFEAKCSLCHSIERPKRKRKTKEGWTRTVMRMKNRNGCPVTDEEAATIIDYLTAHHGPEP
ncbi:MAG: hypothetical protein Kow0092_07860 [Deferrisomatales bacterium]